MKKLIKLIEQNTIIKTKYKMNELLFTKEERYLKEIEEDKKTALGVMKHWHIYDIIAKKKL